MVSEIESEWLRKNTSIRSGELIPDAIYEKMKRECDGINKDTTTVTGSTDSFTGYVQVGEPIKGLRPHRCPICEGRTVMPCDFYGDYENISNMAGEKVRCRSCNGRGYLLIL